MAVHSCHLETLYIQIFIINYHQLVKLHQVNTGNYYPDLDTRSYWYQRCADEVCTVHVL